MKGIVSLEVKTKRVFYKISLRRNITIIRGNSGTGKSTLVQLLQSYERKGVGSGVSRSCNVPVVVLSVQSWQLILKSTNNSLVVIDEDMTSIMQTKEFADIVLSSSNYFLLITRTDLPRLPYSIDEIYDFCNSGVQAVYHEVKKHFRLQEGHFSPTRILVEGKGSEYTFYSSLELPCDYADGKTKFGLKLKEYSGETVLIVADGAAFGSDIATLLTDIKTGNNTVCLYLPESFEWVLLQSQVLHSDIPYLQYLNNPSEHIYSEQYASWERYFTHLLSEVIGSLENHVRRAFICTKSELGKAYLDDINKKRILSVIKGN